MKTLNATLLATLLATAVSGAFAQSGSTTTTTTTTVGSPLVTSTDTKDPKKADAVDKCAQASGSSKTGCLVDSKGNVTTMGEKTSAAGASIANHTENAAEKSKVAQTAVEKTKAAASTVAQKTENMMDTAGDKTRAATGTTAAATDRAADKTKAVASDSVITTKVKASILAAPELKSMGIHVETEKGVVMLSGFVNTKAEANQAIAAAKSVEGVTNVKSAIKVK
jgi:hyperosmotically inducible protein